MVTGGEEAGGEGLEVPLVLVSVSGIDDFLSGLSETPSTTPRLRFAIFRYLGRDEVLSKGH